MKITAVRDGVIAKYNYGRPDYNRMHYGEDKPPVYNISTIPRNLPIFISYGGQDALSDVKDVQLLLDSLKFHDADKLMVQFIKDYAHADFIMGTNAKDIVYNQVLRFFKDQQWYLFLQSSLIGFSEPAASIICLVIKPSSFYVSICLHCFTFFSLSFLAIPWFLLSYWTLLWTNQNSNSKLFTCI